MSENMKWHEVNRGIEKWGYWWDEIGVTENPEKTSKIPDTAHYN